MYKRTRDLFQHYCACMVIKFWRVKSAHAHIQARNGCGRVVHRKTAVSEQN